MSFNDYLPNTMSLDISSLPRALWEAYRDYLWNYAPNSWVAKTAYTCRVLAFLLILPCLILTLLDISAYIVARSLGIVDAAVASTSDKATVHKANSEGIPTINIQPSAPSDSAGALEGEKPNLFGSQFETPPYSSSPSDFFASSDTSLKLSGVGVFSPASSSPPSPTLSRKSFALSESSHNTSTSRLDEDMDEGAIHIRRRKKTAPLTELEPR